MGKIIKKQIQGMSWLSKTGLVLLLTLATTVSMYHGWYTPKQSYAAITTIKAWTEIYTSTTAFPGTVAYPVVAGSGTNRLLIVAVSSSIDLASAQTCSVTYGGQPMTLATSDAGATQSHTYLLYLKEAGLDAAANTNLVFTFSDTASVQHVYAAVYDGVDQTTSIAGISSGTGTTSIAIPSLTIASGDQAVEVVNMNRTVTATYRTLTTPDANWTSVISSANSNDGTIYNSADLLTDSTAGSTTANHAISSATASIYAMSAMSIKAYVPPADSTPPIAGTVTVNPDIASNYTSPAPTITTQFTDLESAVTACQYTTNGGTTWTAGVVSGAGPYICTASPAGLSGALTINMRATSIGGTGTATAITRTVDTSVPTDGTLTVTSGNLQNSLSWTAATDAGSGISSYILRYATGATPPASCAVGTAVPGSPFSGATLSATHSGLTNGTQYSYRLCATDNIGNTSGGATGSGTPISLVSTITSCGACHGYKTTFPDGASRNAGGLFQGSHNKHVITAAISCSVCHVAPATETSADYGHSTGFVQIASPLSGGSYSKASPFAVSNTFTPGTCSGTSCHAAVYATTSGTSPSWGTPGGGCGACHNTTPGVFQGNGAPNTGGHNIHMTAGAACGNCHAGAVTAVTGGSRHGNGFINLTTGYTSPTRNQATKRAAGGTYYTCTAASCHADPYSSGTVTTNVWSPVSSGCGACHKNAVNNGNLGGFITYSSPSTQVGPATASHDEHLNYNRYVCGDCHAGAVSGTTGGSNHGNGVVNIIQYAGTVTKHAAPFTYLANGCAAACHISATWGSQLGCINCHASPITRRKGRVGDVLDAVTTEFGLAWGHKRTGRGAVTDADCIVCHLEGNSTTKRTSKYHADGNIDLRDPDVQGEAPITNLTGGAFTFQRFSTSYAAGSRSPAGATNNLDIAQVISISFCVKCHDSNGATNTTARTTGGTAAMPFGGIALGATYTVANNAIGVQGLIDVKTQFAATNSARHPVLASLTRDFPYSTRLAAPYNNIGTTRNANGSSGHTTATSVVMNCFDCHNVVGTPLTLRTVAAHGNAVTLRGTVYASQPTLCTTCHTGYTVSGTHSTGSAWSATGSNHNASQNCHYCHGSNTSTTAPTRPTRAQDYHGNNALVGGGLWTGVTPNSRPYAFIRGWSGGAYHRPYRSSEFTSGSATCGGGTCPGGGQVGDGSTRTYTAGGTY